ncbi:MAG: hypothetical protein HY921_01580 [Elusimicrobia bacterium]|nr:hypothetical protein [Elusimicrobiota bacterium]
MPAQLLDLFLGLALAGLFHFLVQHKRDPAHGCYRRAAAYFLLALWSWRGLSWVSLRHYIPSGEFVSLECAEVLFRTIEVTALGGLVFAFLRPPERKFSGAFLGSGAGLAFSGFGLLGRLWLSYAAALNLRGSFWGLFLTSLSPWILGSAMVLVMMTLLQDDFRPVAWRMIAAVFAVSVVCTAAMDLRLRRTWGYGPQSLSQAAGLSSEPDAAMSLAWLYPRAGKPYAVEMLKARWNGLSIAPDNLRKIFWYLRERDFRSIFTRDGLEALRRGWLFWWEPDPALESASLCCSSQAYPDYRKALALIRAGPLTRERYESLEALAELARTRAEGFEDVTQSQYIFEAFSAAYARFGDEARARAWLYKIDNLWPIYEKKVEASPVENFRRGRVSGSVLSDLAPADSMKVGLFYVAAGTSAAPGTGVLSASASLDSSGRFEFEDLGAGLYYLGLMGPPKRLRGKIINSPGYFSLSERFPVLRLTPIRIRAR